MVKYSYDAWGNHKVLDGNGNENTSDSFIGNINPFRYKGYYYDKETGLYLVTTRYYNPEWCRFISPDSIEYLDPSNINGMNLYAYCGNDPVNYKQGPISSSNADTPSALITSVNVNKLDGNSLNGGAKVNWGNG